HPTGLLAMTGQASAFPRQDLPEFCENLAALKSEGAGNAGCLSHPQPCGRMKKARKQVTTGTPKQSGIPCAMVLRLPSCSRRSAGLDSLRPPGLMTRGLIPASGDHDHTTSPSASSPRSSAQPRRPSHPAAYVRDDREAPLLVGHEMARTLHLICTS